MTSFLEKQIFNEKGDFNHHAFLAEGDFDYHKEEIINVFLNKNLLLSDKTNLILIKNEKFLLKDALDIRERAYLKIQADYHKLFLINFTKIYHEAENAMLKIFEEPPQKTIFFIIIKNPSVLLPTTISRFNFINLKNEDYPKLTSKKTKNLGQEIAETEKLIKNYKDEKIGLAEIEKYLLAIQREIKITDLEKDGLENLRKIGLLKKSLFGPSPNLKMILQGAVLIKHNIRF